MKVRLNRSRPLSPQSGQAFIIIVIFMAFFLLGVFGLVTDYAQIWAHRQMAQGAADAACQAGAGDLFLQYIDPTGPVSYSWIGSDYNCSANPTSPPCRYASLNGYTPGANVEVTFPGSPPPGVPPIPAGFGTIAHPYIQVKITDPVRLSFSRLITTAASVNSGAKALCGLNPVAVPVPLLVLHPYADDALKTFGTPDIKIFGGPTRSVQVDSRSTIAVLVQGAATIDLSHAGPANRGADFGVFGAESKPAGVNLGADGSWITPGGPVGDPWATVSAPSQPGTPGTATPQPFGVHGCPNPVGCVEFTGGDYTSCSTSGSLAPGANGCLMLSYGGSNPRFQNPVYSGRQLITYAVGARIIPTSGNAGNYVFESSGGTATGAGPATWNQTVGQNTADGAITWTNIGVVTRSPDTAIFAPGLYYVGANGLSLGSNSTVRMSTANGDGTAGVTFYFSTSATVSVASNAGNASACTSASSGSGSPNGCVVIYNVDGSNSSSATGSIPNRALQCPAAGSPAPPPQVPSTVSGNILLGPCSSIPAGTLTYGDPQGQNRGFLFFQNRSTPATPNWGGGGQFLLSGFMYFHYNGTQGTTCGTDTTCLTLQGNSGAGAYTLGNIVADEVALGGTAGISMILNPRVTYQALRPQLLQ